MTHSLQSSNGMISLSNKILFVMVTLDCRIQPQLHPSRGHPSRTPAATFSRAASDSAPARCAISAALQSCPSAQMRLRLLGIVDGQHLVAKRRVVLDPRDRLPYGLLGHRSAPFVGRRTCLLPWVIGSATAKLDRGVAWRTSSPESRARSSRPEEPPAGAPLVRLPAARPALLRERLRVARAGQSSSHWPCRTGQDSGASG